MMYLVDALFSANTVLIDWPLAVVIERVSRFWQAGRKENNNFWVSTTTIII